MEDMRWRRWRRTGLEEWKSDGALLALAIHFSTHFSFFSFRFSVLLRLRYEIISYLFPFFLVLIEVRYIFLEALRRSCTRYCCIQFVNLLNRITACFNAFLKFVCIVRDSAFSFVVEERKRHTKKMSCH
ncbi:hypothetical protein ABFS83_04G147600 [Erythranthe nasuta]